MKERVATEVGALSHLLIHLTCVFWSFFGVISRLPFPLDDVLLLHTGRLGAWAFR